MFHHSESDIFYAKTNTDCCSKFMKGTVVQNLLKATNGYKKLDKT